MKFVTYILIIAFSVLAFDAVAYISGVKETYFPTIEGRLRYPDGYFMADQTLGHDIKPNHPPVEFDWRDHKAMVFSNQYGCFDKNETYTKPLIYVAGDSTAWGYSDYDKKYGTLIEKDTGITVAKCGVTHTGQKHQLQKLKNWIAKTGLTPDIVLMVWVSNDPVNDFLYPQSTVIRDKFVDQVIISSDDNGNAVRRHIPEIDARIAKYEKQQETKGDSTNYTITSRVISLLKEYSTSANIARDLLRKYIGTSLRQTIQQKKKIDLSPQLKQANYTAINEFIRFAEENDITLVFLAYSAQHHKIKDAYEYLQSQNQHVINLADYIQDNGYAPHELRWQIDGHPNHEGNRVMADAYIQYMTKHGLIPE